MRKIEGFIQPFKLEELKDALIKVGVEGMSVLPCKGFGRQLGYGAEETPSSSVKFLDKLKLEIVVEEEHVEEVIEVIKRMARTGTIGAGKIFVIPVEDAIRISTQEVGRSAIR
ncbi:MAG: P-II family nitrogen regulator [Planctomycetes bacterium]|nr:P-II family nitrogen regulator [Planctomycetota bacterium]MBM4080265.1 P-II family nitrogen regulator [Planctomycetota bacterium]